MDSKAIILLRTLLSSTSGLNVLRYSKDKKKRGKIIGGYIGMAIMDIMLLTFCVLTSIGYGYTGITNMIPAMCVIMLSLFSFIFTLLRTNGYLFNFKEYDMIMAMPFEVKTVVACKFLYMYIKNLRPMLIVSLSMMIGYGIFAKPVFYIYFIWILLSLIVPLIPDVVASLLGAFIARVGSGFRLKKLVQTILTMVFIFFCFSLQFIVRAVAKDNSIEDMVNATSKAVESASAIYLPAGWFENAIVNRSLLGMVLFAGVSILVFVLYYSMVAKSYVSINSKLNSHEKSKKGSPLSFKSKTVSNTIAFKEFKRMMGSVTYLTNIGFGYVFIGIASIAVLFINADSIISIITQGAPLTKEMLLPAIPFVVHFFTGMIQTTCCTMSLEGKNYWILQSMPIEKKAIYKGKMLFNMYLSLPFTLLGMVCFGICFGADWKYLLIFILCGLALCCYGTSFGMLCGIAFMKLDWENDIEVVKQGAAVTVYLLPNMFVTMGLTVLCVFLGLKMDGRLVAAGVALVYAVIAAIFYSLVMNKAKGK